MASKAELSAPMLRTPLHGFELPSCGTLALGVSTGQTLISCACSGRKCDPRLGENYQLMFTPLGDVNPIDSGDGEEVQEG